MRQAVRDLAILTFFSIMGSSFSMAADSTNHVPVAAPVDTESSAKGGEKAIASVIRLICRDIGSSGTGFYHRSGKIITAAHVVHGSKNITIPSLDGLERMATVAAIDDDIDIAILDVLTPSKTQPLKISNRNDLKIGTQVSTWGFPGGYSGARPMLSVGYLSGLDGLRLPDRRIIPRWVINAAFNSGNSGGPLVDVERGEVIGVVSSKLAPISRQSQQIIDMLSKQRSGLAYAVTNGNGEQTYVTEGQFIASVLNDLRGQIQLVIGYAVTLQDMRDFLSKSGVDP